MRANKGKDVQWIRKKEKERKKEGREANKGRKEKKSNREREREKWERETKREIFLAFRWSKLNDPRRKVDPRIESYAWVPKSWSFLKFHEIGNFPTLIIFILKVI